CTTTPFLHSKRLATSSWYNGGFRDFIRIGPVDGFKVDWRTLTWNAPGRSTRVLQGVTVRAVVQRVIRAEVRVDGETVGKIGPGILLLLGFAAGDTSESHAAFAQKILNLRIFDDEHGKMNRSLLEAGGGVLCVPQFTLWGDCRKGRRPSFVAAAPPAEARALYESFMEALRAVAQAAGVAAEGGRFQARMEVELINDGPVTVLLDSEKLF
ncbi:MAG: D-aminoacyl-tRNA deacylase, partial [Terriglobia bacterium]